VSAVQCNNWPKVTLKLRALYTATLPGSTMNWCSRKSNLQNATHMNFNE